MTGVLTTYVRLPRDYVEARHDVTYGIVSGQDVGNSIHTRSGSLSSHFIPRNMAVDMWLLSAYVQPLHH